jgi:hypothetical protein
LTGLGITPVPVEPYFFTARFAQDAEIAEEKYYFFSTERAEKK